MLHLVIIGGLVLLSGCAPLAVSGSSQDVFTGSLAEEVQPSPGALVPSGDVPSELIVACHKVMTAQAQSLGATWLEAASAGTPVRLPDGAIDAPLEVRVTYQQKDCVEVRQARHLSSDRAGRGHGLAGTRCFASTSGTIIGSGSRAAASP